MKLNRIVIVALLFGGFGLCIREARAEDFESVASKVSRDYVRRKSKDGSFVPESYAFAKGGYWTGPLFDPTIDKMEFIAIARTLAVPLAFWCRDCDVSFVQPLPGILPGRHSSEP